MGSDPNSAHCYIFDSCLSLLRLRYSHIAPIFHEQFMVLIKQAEAWFPLRTAAADNRQYPNRCKRFEFWRLLCNCEVATFGPNTLHYGLYQDAAGQYGDVVVIRVYY
jgi:hypothetical protein